MNTIKVVICVEKVLSLLCTQYSITQFMEHFNISNTGKNPVSALPDLTIFSSSKLIGMFLGLVSLY